MYFKRFLEFKTNNSDNSLIIFNNNKVIFDKNSNSLILKSLFLNIDYSKALIIGIGEDENSQYLAVDVSSCNFDLHGQGYTSLIETDIRNILTNSTSNVISIIGRAQHLLHWLKTSKYCGSCGSLNKFSSKEGAFYCSCSKEMIYPRISPCVIGIITKGDEILLARNKLFPEGMFSAIAGFVEASETLEETFEREVMEEVGLKIKNIEYFGNQPWPFPNQLMIAFKCDYDSGDIKVDGEEIVEANWFKPTNLPKIPPTTSISGQLIKSYLEDHLKLL